MDYVQYMEHCGVWVIFLINIIIMIIRVPTIKINVYSPSTESSKKKIHKFSHHLIILAHSHLHKEIDGRKVIIGVNPSALTKIFVS